MDRVGARRGGKKKLIDAATWWVNLPAGGAPVDTLAEDMAAFGVKDFEPPDWMRAEPVLDEFDVLPENWDAVNVFLACVGQWSHDKDARPIALRYEALDVVMRHLKVSDPSDVFGRVRIMEQTAVSEFARMRKD